VILLYFFNTVIYLNRDFLNLNCYYLCLLLKLCRWEVLFYIINNLIRRFQIHINLVYSESILYSSGWHILQETHCLKGGWGVDNLKNWFTAEIYNINNNKKVKVVVILESKLELTKRLLIYLAIVTVLYKVLD
jgi:hypothetical protein